MKSRPLVWVVALAAVASSSACNALGLSSACGGTEISGKFQEVGDLVVAANVQSSDVVVGSITKIELDGWEADVTMCLDGGHEISRDVKAVVRTTSLLGEKFVDLQVRSDGPPFLQQGDVIALEDTGKATELEDVFAELAAILGAGNLEQLNRLTSAQAKILRDHAGDVRVVLRQLHKFTDTLASRKDDIALAVDSLDSVARAAVDEAAILEGFLDSFASSSSVLDEQEAGLRSLFETLDRFTNVTVQLLRETKGGVEEQLRDLRPILRTVVANSQELRESLVTLATFTEYFPESMPGDYLQLDVCQAGEGEYGQGTTCPQSLAEGGGEMPQARNAIELIMRLPLIGARSGS